MINRYLFKPKMLPEWQVTHCRHSLQLVMKKCGSLPHESCLRTHYQTLLVSPALRGS